MNWVDFLLIGIVLLEVFIGWRSGFLRSMFGLLTWVVSFLLAFIFYPSVSIWINNITGLSQIWARPSAFLLITFLGIFLIGWLSRIVVRRIPYQIHQTLGNHLLGILPGLVNGLVTAGIVALLVLTLPLPAQISTSVQDSRLANYISIRTERIQVALDQVFGEAISRTLTTITIPPDSSERIDLPYTVSNPEVRPDLEAEMITLVNNERKAVGLEPLEADVALREVARRHSADMFIRGYFSHITPEGLTPFDRIREAGISYLIAGENLALAPTLHIAHNGLMNSPGHRANILRPQFGRIGIGIMYGGSRGVMITQLFRN